MLNGVYCVALLVLSMVSIDRIRPILIFRSLGEDDMDINVR